MTYKPSISTEILTHFQCGHCRKWWTIGDAPKANFWYCPWCSYYNTVTPDDRTNEQHQTILTFVAAVNRRALANIARTGRVEGAHYNAMRQELREMGLEMPTAIDEAGLAEFVAVLNSEHGDEATEAEATDA